MMKINSIGAINNIQNKDNPNNKKANQISKEKNTPAAVFEKSRVEDKGHVYDKTTIDKLKMDSEKSYVNLKRMVEDMLQRQGKSINLVHSGDLVDVDATARAEASELIGPDGPLGIEAVSDKIVDFAIAVSGGDKSKLETLRKAIDKGFKEAERILGGLPEISSKTYDSIMKKLDNWEKEDSDTNPLNNKQNL